MTIGNHESVYPNPSNGDFTFEVQSLYPTPVNILIFDIMGNLIRQIRTDISADSRQIIKWDGRSDNGANAPAGIYLVNVRTSVHTEVLKIIKE